jgi:hypothetical protein
LSLELATTITPGFEALVFKASRGIEDIYELTYIRKDGSRFPAHSRSSAWCKRRNVSSSDGSGKRTGVILVYPSIDRRCTGLK